MITVLSFFTDNGVMKTGLSPIIEIRDISNGNLLVNGAAMTEVGSGFYKYDYTGDETLDLAIVADGTSALGNSERYVFAGNHLREVSKNVEDILKVEKGRWKILNNQMTLYDNDGTTVLYKFNLKDKSGNPTDDNVFERTPV